MYGVACRVTKNLCGYERRAVCSLLEREGLIFEGAPDFTALAEDDCENIIATASLSGNVIKMVASDPQWRGEGLSGSVISALMSEARSKGLYKFFIYTKPEAAGKFSALGFREIASSGASALLECGVPGIDEYRAGLLAQKAKNGAPAGAAVMNCNPFTFGHRYLIERGAASCGVFYVIVVEEEASAFPFKDRIEMVRRGTADIPNVRVLASGSYAVSKATFPSYFLKDRSEASVAREQAKLDARLFGGLFVPSLGVSRRFVGTEPFCPVTAVYNSVLKETLPQFGCEVEEIKRAEIGGSAVSASRVRDLLASGDPSAAELLPETTAEYLKSPEGIEAVKKLKERAGAAS